MRAKPTWIKIFKSWTNTRLHKVALELERRKQKTLKNMPAFLAITILFSSSSISEMDKTLERIPAKCSLLIKYLSMLT